AQAPNARGAAAQNVRGLNPRRPPTKGLARSHRRPSWRAPPRPTDGPWQPPSGAIAATGAHWSGHFTCQKRPHHVSPTTHDGPIDLPTHPPYRPGMDRRRFLFASLAGTLAAPLAAEAQEARKVARIGYLEIEISSGDSGLQAFLEQLRDLGYVEGRNLYIEYRDAKRNPERFPALAAELVAINVDVIVAGGGSLGALAAKKATGTIPIVFPLVGDPVEDGLVNSLARPGGNLTGSSLLAQTVEKLLELLKQAAPAISRVALLLKPDAAPARTLADNISAAERA